MPSMTIAEFWDRMKHGQPVPKKLSDLEIQVDELQPPEFFALLQIRGSMPAATVEQATQLKESSLGMEPAVRLGLFMQGVELLEARGAVFRPGTRGADGEPELWVYPRIRVLAPMVSARDLKAIRQVLGDDESAA